MVLPMPPRFDRQEELIPRARMLQESATVIGVGAVGRQVALQLVALGIPRLQLIDFATVTLADVIAEGFLSEDVGAPKVDAVGGLCHRAEPLLDLQTLCERFRPSQVAGANVFCCLAAKTDRLPVWEPLCKHCRFWGDASRSAEAVRVLVAGDEGDHRSYRRILADSDGDAARPAAVPLAYMGALAAALLMHQFVRYLRNQPLVVDATFDFATGTYVVAG